MKLLGSTMILVYQILLAFLSMLQKKGDD